MTDGQTGRHVKLSDEDQNFVLGLLRSVTYKVVGGICLAGLLGAATLWKTQAIQEEANKAVLQKIDYKYEQLAEGQREAKEQVRLIVDPLDKRLQKTESLLDYIIRKKKLIDEE